MARRLTRLKAAIVARDRTIASVAEAVAVSPGVLYRVIGGHAAPWPALRARLAKELDLTEAELFDDSCSTAAA